MLPKGFVASGIHCGIAKKRNKKDIAIFFSLYPAVASGMFTSNLVKAAPVLLSQKYLRNGKNFRGIVANSGCANACTGRKGMDDAETVCEASAKLLKVESGEILAASTGVIGQFLPLARAQSGLKKLAVQVLKGRSSETAAVEAIMTTDTFPKVARREALIDKRRITIWGCAKGAGMIHPSMKPFHATMLSFIMTDASITPFALDKALNNAVEKSFNCVSVDGDTSTNDTVLALANGAALNRQISDKDKNLAVFEGALTGVCLELAKMVAADGEGATKFIEIEVKNADTEKTAKRIAETVATSPLVKTAVFGNDANWGRIMAAAGRSGAKINPDRIDVFFGKLMVARRGTAVKFSERKALRILKDKKVRITVDLHQGKKSAKYYTCDFSFDYVKENASYRS
ncbi:MAG: bifunctional glutamate N-acetyltransferase/amino-acid acetyltransferase ArgJ [Elusimicrobiota bacterium]